MIRPEFCKKKGHEKNENNIICFQSGCPLNDKFCILCSELHNDHRLRCTPIINIDNYVNDILIAPMEKEVIESLQNYQSLLSNNLSQLKISNVKFFSSNQIYQLPNQNIKEKVNQIASGLDKILNIIKDFNTNIGIAIEQVKFLITDLNMPNTMKQIEQQKMEQSNQSQQQQSAIDKKEYQIEAQKNQQKQALLLSKEEIDIESISGYQDYLITLTNLISQNSNFSDKDFSLGGIIDAFFRGQIFWARASDFAGKVQFFCNDVGPNFFGENKVEVQFSDIIPGRQGNDSIYCLAYLLGNFCPKLLKDVFITQEIAQYGIYAVKLQQKRKDLILYIDDVFPYNKQIQQHTTLMGKNNSIWILVLEKALAKIFGSYLMCSACPAPLLVGALFSNPTITLFTKQEYFFDLLETELKANSFILVKPKQGVNNNGLQKGYYIQVVAVKLIQNPDYQDVMLVQLRYPWGGKQWKGEWGYQSLYWTSELKKELGQSDEDNGLFFMDSFSFMQQFATVISCRINTLTSSSILFCCRKNQGVYFKLNILTEDNYAFEARAVKEEKSNEYFTKIFIAKIEDGQSQTSYQYVDATVKLSYINSAFSVNLPVGSYAIYVKMIWNHNQMEDAIFKVYSNYRTSISQIQKIPNLIATAMELITRQKGKSQNYFSNAKCKTYLTLGWDSMLLENPNSYSLLFPHRSISNGLSICKPYNKSNVDIQLHSGQQIMVISKPDLQLLKALQFDGFE